MPKEVTYKIALVENRLDDAANEGSTVDELFVLWYGDELVDYGLSFDDIVCWEGREISLKYLKYLWTVSISYMCFCHHSPAPAYLPLFQRASTRPCCE